jgi:hypothetical protein
MRPSLTVPKNIENYRNPGGLENERFTEEIPYFLRFFLFPSNLRTVDSEVQILYRPPRFFHSSPKGHMHH